MLYLFIILDNVLIVTDIIFISTFNVINYIEYYENIGIPIFVLFWENSINIQYDILWYNLILLRTY